MDAILLQLSYGVGQRSAMRLIALGLTDLGTLSCRQLSHGALFMIGGILLLCPKQDFNL